MAGVKNKKRTRSRTVKAHTPFEKKIGGHNHMRYAWTDWVTEHNIDRDSLKPEHKTQFTLYYTPKLRPDSDENDPVRFSRTLDDLYKKTILGELKLEEPQDEKSFWHKKTSGLVLSDVGKQWLKKHLFVHLPHPQSTKLDFVLVDNDNVCTYYPAMGDSKSTAPLMHHIIEIEPRFLNRYPKISTADLDRFNENTIERDDANTIMFYFENCSVRITAKKIQILDIKKRGRVWNTSLLKHTYNKTKQKHEIEALSKHVVRDTKRLLIGLGYLLHRHWFRNATKIVWAVDENPKGTSDGRRGKDLFTKLVELARELVSVQWKKDSRFWTGNINASTQNIHFEEAPRGLLTDPEVKKDVTGDFMIEGKGTNPISIPFEKKPKMSASSHEIPIGYENTSDRGRVYLIQMTDYLQNHRPKKTLVYNDKDKSAFFQWLFKCAQMYLRNKKELEGVSDISDETKIQLLKKRFGSTVVNVCEDVRKSLKRKNKKKDYVSARLVTKLLDCDDKDNKTKRKFMDCYLELYRISIRNDVHTENGKQTKIYKEEKT